MDCASHSAPPRPLTTDRRETTPLTTEEVDRGADHKVNAPLTLAHPIGYNQHR